MQKFLIFLIVGMYFLTINVTNAANMSDYFPGQVVMKVYPPPTPFKALNKYYLIYEIYLTSYQKNPFTLSSFTINTDNQQKFTFSGKQLAKIVWGIGKKNPEKNPLIFLPGISKMIYVWLPFTMEKNLPAQLTHDIKFKTSEHILLIKPEVKVGPLLLKKTMPIIVDPPLKGNNWVATNGPSPTSAHRTSHLVVEGHNYFAQRYAIDFVQVNEHGLTHYGDPFKNNHYFCYGKNIFAVANGHVVKILDGLPDNIPFTGKLAVPLTLKTIGGNYVVIDIGGGKYAFYAHMLAHSITVKKGDYVKRGEILGKIGNTGNSGEPHLHFHVVDQPSFLGANGIPYGFTQFWVRDAEVIPNAPIPGVNEEIKLRFLNDKTHLYTNQLVLENMVINFDFP